MPTTSWANIKPKHSRWSTCLWTNRNVNSFQFRQRAATESTESASALLPSSAPRKPNLLKKKVFGSSNSIFRSSSRPHDCWPKLIGSCHTWTWVSNQSGALPTKPSPTSGPTASNISTNQKWSRCLKIRLSTNKIKTRPQRRHQTQRPTQFHSCHHWSSWSIPKSKESTK